MTTEFSCGQFSDAEDEIALTTTTRKYKIIMYEVLKLNNKSNKNLCDIY